MALADLVSVVGDDRTANVPARAIYRQAECHSGTVEIGVDFSPRFDCARAETIMNPPGAPMIRVGCPKNPSDAVELEPHTTDGSEREQ